MGHENGIPLLLLYVGMADLRSMCSAHRSFCFLVTSISPLKSQRGSFWHAQQQVDQNESYWCNRSGHSLLLHAVLVAPCLQAPWQKWSTLTSFLDIKNNNKKKRVNRTLRAKSVAAA